MKQYKIFQHPDHRIDAVKDGWSWPGFFFGPFWALSRGLILLGCGSWLGIFLLAAAIASSSGAKPGAAGPVFNFVGLLAAVLFGAVGNSLRERKLTSEGYEIRDVVSASTPDEAISLYASSLQNSGIRDWH